MQTFRLLDVIDWEGVVFLPLLLPHANSQVARQPDAHPSGKSNGTAGMKSRPCEHHSSGQESERDASYCPHCKRV